MSKIIVFCADGTWNGPDVVGEANTNVYKLFQNLQGETLPGTPPTDKQQERLFRDEHGTLAQVAKYIDGVGDSNNWLVHYLGGGLGAGIITRIVRGYTFISREYRAGDRIVLTGFSRGAYTVRALAALISDKGLMDATRLGLTGEPASKERAYRLGAAVWHAHASAVASSNTSLIGKLQEFLTNWRGALTSAPAQDEMIAAEIAAVGVWDTVGALGIPILEGMKGQIDTFQFADLRLSPNVKRGFHAVSIDEMRANFMPTLWEKDPGRVTQVLFPGAHSDVGGGYPEDGLSNAALIWMTAQLQGTGVLFRQVPDQAHPADALATAHKPWFQMELPVAMRRFDDGMERSDSLRDRLEKRVQADVGERATLYDPPNLPV